MIAEIVLDCMYGTAEKQALVSFTLYYLRHGTSPCFYIRCMRQLVQSAQPTHPSHIMAIVAKATLALYLP